MTILIVDADPSALAATARIVFGAGYQVVTASSFEDACTKLAYVKPDALIANIQLGPYNGLHLVFRARVAHPAIVAFVTHAAADRVLAADADAAGVVYLVKPLTSLAVVPILRARLATRPDVIVSDLRQWPRKITYRRWGAHVGWGNAEVIDISYGGLRLEIVEAGEAPRFDADIVVVPDAGVALHTRCVWMKKLEAQKSWTGVAVDDQDPHAIEAWRRFVDRA